MKKYILLSIALYAILIVSAYSGDKNDMIREDDEEMKKERLQWIEEMHRAAPGINWRIIERETGESKARSRRERTRKRIALGIPLSETKTVAGGRIEGQWTERGSDNQSGRIMVADIDFDSDLIYCVSAGGNIWRGRIDGSDWISLNDEEQIHGKLIRILKINRTRRILVVSNNSVRYSDNSGKVWEHAEGLENLQRWGSVKHSVVANDEKNSIYFICTEWDYENWQSIQSIYQSTDRGESFKRIKVYDKPDNYLNIWAPRYGASDVFVLHRDTLFTLGEKAAFDDYKLFTDHFPADKENIFRNLVFSGNYSNGKYTLGIGYYYRENNQNRTEFHVSNDTGATWQYKGSVNEGPFTLNSFGFSASDSDIMAFGGVNCYRSYDGGGTWKIINSWAEYYGDPENLLHADIPSITSLLSPEEDEIEIITTDGGLYFSNDKFSSVKNKSLKGHNVSQYYSVLTHAVRFLVQDGKPEDHTAFDKDIYEVIFAGSQDQGFQRAIIDSSGPHAFEQTISGDYGNLNSSDGGFTVWSVYPTFAMLYINATEEFVSYSWSFGSHKNKQWLPDIVAIPEMPESALIAAGSPESSSGSYLWLIQRSGKEIIPSQMPFDFSEGHKDSKLTSIGISPFTSDHLYALTNDGRFLHSDDFGFSWTEGDSTGMGGHYFYGSSILPSKLTPGRVIIAGSGYSNHAVFLTTDNGGSFTPIDSGLPNTLVFDIAMTEDEKFLFAATDSGPYIYSAEDSVWYDLTADTAPDQNYWSVEYIPLTQTARFATYGRGIWDFKIEQFTSVGNESQRDISLKPEIDVRPNPMKDLSSIRINMPESAFAVVRIYDLSGRIVAEPCTGILPSGISEIKWDGCSIAGKSLPAGSYMCTVAANGMANHTMIIIE